MDYFKKIDEIELLNNENNDGNNNCFINKVQIDSKVYVDNLIMCPNCDSEYNSDKWCDCWYWLNIDDLYMYHREEKRRRKISEANKWNWKKIEILRGIFYYDFYWRIWNWSAEIDILINWRNKEKKQKIKFLFKYDVIENKTYVWETEWKVISKYLLEWLKVYENEKWIDIDLDNFKTKKFLSNKIYEWRNIEYLLFMKILNDYRYNKDLILD